MTSVESLMFPSFLWKLGDINLPCKRKGPSFAFAGDNWRLKLVHCNHCDGAKIQIFLKRISFCKNIPGLSVRTTTSIIDAGGSKYVNKLSQKLSVGDFSMFCIWESSTVNLAKLSLWYLKDFTVLFALEPGDAWSELLDIGQSDETDTSPMVSSESPDSLNQDIGKLFDSHVLSDIILLCGDKKIYAHKAILSARSEVFAAMFRHDLKDSQEIKDMEPSVLELLIRFIYTGEIPRLSSDLVHKIYAAADMYGLERLKMKCALLMMNNTEEAKSDNVVTAVDEDNETLKERVMSHFANIKAVVMTEEWKQLSRYDSNLANGAFEFLIKRSPALV